MSQSAIQRLICIKTLREMYFLKELCGLRLHKVNATTKGIRLGHHKAMPTLLQLNTFIYNISTTRLSHTYGGSENHMTLQTI